LCIRGIIDHSSNMPDPVAMSLSEEECNQAFIAMMALMHISMALREFELRDEVHRRIIAMQFKYFL